jgi:2-aminoadipate transaminase
MHSGLSALGQRTAAPPVSWLMRLTLDHPRLISLAAGFTDNAALPVAHTRQLLQEILASPKLARPALQYGSTVGDPQLRHLTAAHLQSADGQFCSRAGAQIYSPDRLLITNGSQQLLYMVTEVLCDPGDIVLVEDPTYFVFLGILQSHGVQCRAIHLQEDGLDTEHLADTLRALHRSGQLPRVKMLYVVSYYQNPTGITTSPQKKAAILRVLRQFEKAAGHKLYLLEDAAYRELRFAGPDVPSALAVESDPSRVIYAGTFSKPFATGARVGFGLLPAELFEAVARVKGNHDFGSANLLQQLLARALASGRYQAHVTSVAKRYAQKAALMCAMLRAHFPAAVQWTPPQGGLYVWARLPQRVATGFKSNVFKAALKRQVLYVPGELCYADDPTRPKPRHEMRLSFGGATPKDIRLGIQRLGQVLSQVAGRWARA